MSVLLKSFFFAIRRANYLASNLKNHLFDNIVNKITEPAKPSRDRDLLRASFDLDGEFLISRPT